jgi:uncharacterized membrane protein
MGLVCLATGIGGLAGENRWAEIIDEMERSPALLMAIAFVGIALGLVVILAHHSFADPLAAVVTFIGAWSFFEGLVLLAIPGAYLRFVRPLLRHAKAWAIFAVALGLILIVAGLTGRADPIASI